MVYLTEVDVRALREQAHAIRELTQHPGWAVYTDYLNHIMIGDKKRLLNDGGIASIEEYKKVAGRLEGITRSINVPAEVQALSESAAALAQAERAQEPSDDE